MKKKIKIIRGILKEFLFNGTQHISRIDFYNSFSEFIEDIEDLLKQKTGERA